MRLPTHNLSVPNTPCVRIFENAPENNGRVEHIDKEAPNCCCEPYKVSQHCDEPVCYDETLVRFVVDPFHIANEGGRIRLNSSFFNDASTVGASSLRKERASPEEYEIALNELIGENISSPDGTPRRLYGVVLVPVGEVKGIKHSIEKIDGINKIIETPDAFGVYATGLEGRPNHSDVMVNRRSQISKSKANRAGINLAKSLQEKILTVEQFKEVIDLTKWSE